MGLKYHVARDTVQEAKEDGSVRIVRSISVHLFIRFVIIEAVRNSLPGDMIV